METFLNPIYVAVCIGAMTIASAKMIAEEKNALRVLAVMSFVANVFLLALFVVEQTS